jgi:hypothetical protein
LLRSGNKDHTTWPFQNSRFPSSTLPAKQDGLVSLFLLPVTCSPVAAAAIWPSLATSGASACPCDSPALVSIETPNFYGEELDGRSAGEAPYTALQALSPWASTAGRSGCPVSMSRRQEDADLHRALQPPAKSPPPPRRWASERRRGPPIGSNPPHLNSGTSLAPPILHPAIPMDVTIAGPLYFDW